VHELLKFHRGNTILYNQISQHKGALIRIPSMGTSSHYERTLKKKGNFMDHVLDFMSTSLKKLSDDEAGGNREAAKCLLQYLFENYEEEFRAIKEKNNVALRSEKKWKLARWKPCFMSHALAKNIHVFCFTTLTIFLENLCLHQKRFGISIFLGMSSNQ
jgi:hypothetical protein